MRRPWRWRLAEAIAGKPITLALSDGAWIVWVERRMSSAVKAKTIELEMVTELQPLHFEDTAYHPPRGMHGTFHGTVGDR